MGVFHGPLDGSVCPPPVAACTSSWSFSSLSLFSGHGQPTQARQVAKGGVGEKPGQWPLRKRQQGDLHPPLREEIPAPNIKRRGKDIRLDSSKLTVWTKTFERPHTFRGFRNTPYPSYRNICFNSRPLWGPILARNNRHISSCVL